MLLLSGAGESGRPEPQRLQLESDAGSERGEGEKGNMHSRSSLSILFGALILPSLALLQLCLSPSPEEGICATKVAICEY